MAKELKDVDPSFDFKNVYKRNYNTLINIRIQTVEYGHTFMVDNEKKAIRYPSPLHVVEYREWSNPNWFAFRLHDESNPIYWTTEEKAKEWFDAKKYSSFGLKIIDENEAQKLAQEKLVNY